MIAGTPNSIEFDLIFIPLSLIFSIKQFFMNINNKNYTINNDNYLLCRFTKEKSSYYYLFIIC